MNILNLTQHTATEDQLAAGVSEPSDKAEVQRLLTFEALPTEGEIFSRALALAEIAKGGGADAAMIGGAPFLMAPLEEALRTVGLSPVYAFSTRETVEDHLPDGSVRKTQVFRHSGFVPATGRLCPVVEDESEALAALTEEFHRDAQDLLDEAWQSAEEAPAPPKLVVYEHDCHGASTHHLRKYKHWAKVVREVDLSKTDGYAFVGDFLRVEQDHMLPTGSLVVEVCDNRYDAYVVGPEGKDRIADGRRGSLAPFVRAVAEFMKEVK